MYSQAVRLVAPTPPDDNDEQIPKGALSSRAVIVKVENVGKAFRRFEVQPFLLRNLALRIVGKAPKPKEFWPLQDVSFEIRQGETVGLVGHNGCGKSTLLRIIAGACYPTKGRVQLRGRVAPLLSLGVGFQPDMTGRECIEINATALGMSRDEIAAAEGPMADFAELRDFLETPVRFYSSGMMARLGFAIAIYSTPDLLLLDEVLAVGDHNFQKKCIARIRELQEAGTTILYVSHSEGSVQELCSRAIWLHDGRIAADGDPADVVEAYLRR
jgi:ABC-type polysaccharide/polyol phosphate transport system ATPase subunit